jgi:hypothetical protein
VLSVFLTFQEFSLGFSVSYIEFMTTRFIAWFAVSRFPAGFEGQGGLKGLIHV